MKSKSTRAAISKAIIGSAIKINFISNALSSNCSSKVPKILFSDNCKQIAII